MESKEFKTYHQQVALLESRGMIFDDKHQAISALTHINYYRLSGYWYSWREIDKNGHRLDTFVDETYFTDILALYEFDRSLREAVFHCASDIEIEFRSLLGHELGRINPFIHLSNDMLGSLARKRNNPHEDSIEYSRWLDIYMKDLSTSREDFVVHHKKKYDGKLPIWAAVEIMDWGSLSYLYRFSPSSVQKSVSDLLGLSPAQLGSWLKVINVLRNTAAHHSRMFNKVYTLTPKMPDEGENPLLTSLHDSHILSRLFGQLSLIQYVLIKLNIGDASLLPQTLRSYPHLKPLPLYHLGIPQDWQMHPLWSFES